MERYLRVNLLGPCPPSSYEKRIYRAAVSQKLRNTALGHQEISRLHETQRFIKLPCRLLQVVPPVSQLKPAHHILVRAFA